MFEIKVRTHVGSSQTLPDKQRVFISFVASVKTQSFVCALEAKPLALWTCTLAHTLSYNISRTKSKVIDKIKGQGHYGKKCKKSSFYPRIGKYGPKGQCHKGQGHEVNVVGQGHKGQGQSSLGSFLPPSTRGRFDTQAFSFWDICDISH